MKIAIRSFLLCVSALVSALASACAPPPLTVTPASAPRAETDEPALVRVAQGGAALGLARHVRALPDGRALVVTPERALVLVDGGARRVLLDGVVGSPAVLDGARVVVAREAARGIVDLWVVSLDGGAKPRAIAAHAGVDGQPFVLDDGRVLFVSDRTGVASIFIVSPDVDAHAVTQLTNRGERAGALSAAFVPPPLAFLDQDGARVRYDAGDAIVELDVDTGEVSR